MRFSWTRQIVAPVAVAILAAVLLAGPTGAPTAPSAAGHDHADITFVANQQPAGLDTLGDTCDGNSDLPLHDGFQSATPRCVDTQFGEHAAQADAPSLLIVDAPVVVRSGQDIVLKVSVRNLVRDRFLAAGQGGYYLESSFLNGDGLIRGHFHTACRLIGNGKTALPPDRQASFRATEDGGGGRAPDTVTVTVPGLAGRGLAQCVVWAGDGSHRVPMASFANQIPAIDARRLLVR